MSKFATVEPSELNPDDFPDTQEDQPAEPQPAFGFTLTGEDIAVEGEDDDDEIATEIAGALAHYRRGNHKAAMARLHDAMNSIADDHGIQGGAWI